MKVLVLGSSRQYARPGISQEQSFGNRLDRDPRIASLPLDIVRHFAWPTDKLPGLVEKWATEESPDLVTVLINEAWFNYERLPLKSVRKKGPLGRLANHVWRITAQNPVVMNSRLAHRARRRLAEAIGAGPEFTPDEVVERMATVFRVILRGNEGTSILVVGPLNLAEFDAPYSAKAATRRLARRERVNTGVAALCRDLHLQHIDMHHEALKGRTMPSVQADSLHTDAEGSQQDARFWSSVLAPFLMHELIRRGELPGITPPSP